MGGVASVRSSMVLWMCEMTYSYVGHDSYAYGTWRSHM